MLARIRFEFQSSTIASHVMDAVSPDNTPLPPGLKIRVELDGHGLSLEIESERSIDSFRGTIEDIMSAIDLSLRTMDSVEPNQ